MVKVLLTDIEGTTSSIAFVKEVLFPYARQQMASFIRNRAEDPAVQAELATVRAEAPDTDEVETLLSWIDEDRKATALKTLQGMIWEAGYADGSLKGHIYPDAADGLRRLREAGCRLAVYSSGSVQAQKLLFAHTQLGDLSALFEAHFDTKIGSKRDPDSYRRIAEALDVGPEQVRFASDVEAELDAAAEAGMETVQLVRPEDGTKASSRHLSIPSFDGLDAMGAC